MTRIRRNSKSVPLTAAERQQLVNAPLPTFRIFSGLRWGGACVTPHTSRHPSLEQLEGSPSAYGGIFSNFDQEN
jgi:hypothetical protein